MYITTQCAVYDYIAPGVRPLMNIVQLSSWTGVSCTYSLIYTAPWITWQRRYVFWMNTGSLSSGLLDTFFTHVHSTVHKLCSDYNIILMRGVLKPTVNLKVSDVVILVVVMLDIYMVSTIWIIYLYCGSI